MHFINDTWGHYTITALISTKNKLHSSCKNTQITLCRTILLFKSVVSLTGHSPVLPALGAGSPRAWGSDLREHIQLAFVFRDSYRRGFPLHSHWHRAQPPLRVKGANTARLGSYQRQERFKGQRASVTHSGEPPSCFIAFSVKSGGFPRIYLKTTTES